MAMNTVYIVRKFLEVTVVELETSSDLDIVEIEQRAERALVEVNENEIQSFIINEGDTIFASVKQDGNWISRGGEYIDPYSDEELEEAWFSEKVKRLDDALVCKPKRSNQLKI